MSAAEPAAAAPAQGGRRFHWDCLWSLAGGAFMALAYPPYDVGNLVWVGLLPLLSVLWCGRAGFWRGFRQGWLYGWAGTA